MINWNNYFDKIYCIHFINYTERKQLIKKQLKRVGILDSNLLYWQYTYGTKLDKKFEKYIKSIKDPNNRFLQVSILLGHYECIRNAYYKGYNKILIIEDDVRFLKQINQIQNILNFKPKNANIILYDKFINNSNKLNQFKFINQYYSTFTSCCSAGCYELDKKGIKRLKNLIETSPQPADGYFYVATQFLEGLKYYCAIKNLCIQIPFKNSNMTKILQNQNIQNIYHFLNINFDDYMIGNNNE